MREFMNITKALADAKKSKDSEAIRETVRPLLVRQPAISPTFGDLATSRDLRPMTRPGPPTATSHAPSRPA